MNPLNEIKDITNKLSLLIVEDDIDVRGLLTLALKPFFKKILEASDGLQGLDFFYKTNVDLVITDQQMPKLKGIEMIRKIRSVNPDLPIILITAFTEIDVLIDAINLGVNKFLLKPVLIETLYKTVQEALTSVIAKEKALMEQEYNVLKIKDEFNLLQKKLALSKQRVLTRNDFYYKKIDTVNDSTWLINTKYIPYDILSGDFYSIRVIQNDAIVLTLMDAVGKGLSAFVSSSIITTFLNYYIDFHIDRFDFLLFTKTLVDYVVKQLTDDEALCIVFLFIDLNKNIMTIVNFGMPPVLAITKKQEPKIFYQDYLPITKCEEITIKNSFTLDDIEKIVLLSDGIYEPQYEDCLIKDLIKSPFKTVFIENVLKYVEKNQDDMSIIFLKKFNLKPKWSKRFSINSKLQSVHSLINDVETLLNEMNLNIQFVVESITAINEMVMNAYEHGSLAISRIEKNRLLKEDIYEETLIEFEQSVDKEILLDIRWYNESDIDYFVYTIKDEGDGFDTQIINDTIVDSDNLNYRGIKITKGLVDEIYYNSKGNEVLLIKRNII